MKEKIEKEEIQKVVANQQLKKKITSKSVEKNVKNQGLIQP